MQNKLIGIKTKSKQSRQANIFYWTMFALPLLQFFIFYIIANAGSIYLAFFQWTPAANAYTLLKDDIFWNFKDFFVACGINAGFFKTVFLNSLFVVLVSLLINVVICLIFSYYIYKNFRFSKFYKLILFLPSIISATVLSIYFLRFDQQCLSRLSWFPIKETLNDEATLKNYPLVVFFAFFTGFGPTVLVYSNAMSNIPKSLIEAAELDGASELKQFFSVIIPYIWPTIVSYITISIVAFSANQLGLYTFFPSKKVFPEVQNFAYIMFYSLTGAPNRTVAAPMVAAGGLFLTAIVAPTSILLNKLLTRFGPSEK